MNYEDKRRKVEKLLHGKYPFSWAPPPISSLRASAVEIEVGQANQARHTELVAEIKAERQRLMDMPDVELDTAFDDYIQGLRRRGRLDEENKERIRFFNLPNATADFDYWSKAEFWSLDEAVALLLGKSPEMVNWKSIQPFTQISEFAKQYERLRNLAIRAQAMNRGQSSVYPGAVIGWADEMDIPIPPKLRNALAIRRARKTASAVAQAPAPPAQVELPAPQTETPVHEDAVATSPTTVHESPKDGAPRATWLLGLEALVPQLESELKRPAEVREVIRYLKAHGKDFEIYPDGGPNELFWKTLMGDRKPVNSKTVSNAMSTWRKGRHPA